MSIRSKVGPLIPAAIKTRLPDALRGPYWEGFEPYIFAEDGDIRADIIQKYGYDGDLLDLFVNNRGAVVHKWHHYLPIYERYFAPFRNRPIRFLEIGVSKGGSLQMWRKYFGDDAIIFGIDIEETCRQFDGQAGQVRIGSQNDPAFLEAVVAEMGGIDLVLDDGSHEMPHIKASLETLFPLLHDEHGVYMIEDLHTAYWPSWGGGPRNPANFFKYLGEMVDDMHRWYHPKGINHPATAANCPAIHIHDSIVVLEKGQTFAPVNSEVG